MDAAAYGFSTMESSLGNSLHPSQPEVESSKVETKDNANASFESENQLPLEPNSQVVVDMAAFVPASKDRDNDASDVDTKVNFSFEATGEDDVSTLGDTIGASIQGGNIMVLPPQNEFGRPSMELPLRRFPQELPIKNSEDRLTIRLVPTEDTSQGSPKDESNTNTKANASDKTGPSNLRRIIFFLSFIMAPVLLCALFVLVFMLIRLRQGQGLSNAATTGETAFPTNTEDANDLIYAPIFSPTLSPFSSSNGATIAPAINPTEHSVPKPVLPDTQPITPSPTTRFSTITPTSSPAMVPTSTPLGMTIVAWSAFPTTTTMPPTLNPTSEPTLVSTTMQPTFFPTPTGTTLTPTSLGSELVTTSATNSETALPFTTLPAFGQPPYPYLRFVAWQDFRANADSGLQNAVTSGLGYNQFAWNNPGTAEIEGLTYENIFMQYPSYAIALIVLGFATSTDWNCWINHYFIFDWDELTQLPEASEAEESRDLVDRITDYGLQVQRAWEVLGWSSTTWKSEDPSQWPSSESKSWQDLTTTEQDAAEILCFDRELWDQVPIPNW